MTVESAPSSSIGKRYWMCASEMALGANDCDSSGPRLKLWEVSEGAGSVEQVSQFTQAGVRPNLRRNADANLRSRASGIRSWGLFRDTTRRRHFPPTEEAILGWSSIATGRTFMIYIARLGDQDSHHSSLRTCGVRNPELQSEASRSSPCCRKDGVTSSLFWSWRRGRSC